LSINLLSNNIEENKVKIKQRVLEMQDGCLKAKEKQKAVIVQKTMKILKLYKVET